MGEEGWGWGATNVHTDRERVKHSPSHPVCILFSSSFTLSAVWIFIKKKKEFIHLKLILQTCTKLSLSISLSLYVCQSFSVTVCVCVCVCVCARAFVRHTHTLSLILSLSHTHTLPSLQPPTHNLYTYFCFVVCCYGLFAYMCVFIVHNTVPILLLVTSLFSKTQI